MARTSDPKTTGPEKTKQSLYFSVAVLKEISREATRQDRSLSWIVQKAWKAARREIRRMPASGSRAETTKGPPDSPAYLRRSDETSFLLAEREVRRVGRGTRPTRSSTSRQLPHPDGASGEESLAVYGRRTAEAGVLGQEARSAGALVGQGKIPGGRASMAGFAKPECRRLSGRPHDRKRPRRALDPVPQHRVTERAVSNEVKLPC